MKAMLIAELGSSPAPEWNLAEWVEMAQWSGADAVKVQMFRVHHFPEGEREEKRALEFPRERWGEFVGLAHEWRMKAGASVFDPEAVRLAADQGDFIKVAAREELNRTLLEYIGTYNPKHLPVYRSVSDTSIVESGGVYGMGDVVLMTIPRYPAPLVMAMAGVLRAAREFGRIGRRWGWSSHTRGWIDCWLAARMGAEVVEKHFALSKADLEAGHSLRPEGFRRLRERMG